MKTKYWLCAIILMFCCGFTFREFSRVNVEKNPHQVISAKKATPKTIKEAMKLSKKNGRNN